MSTNNRVAELLADSKQALLNGQFEESLRLAVEARDIEPNNAEVHKCTGTAYMLMKKMDEAEKCYSIAAKCEPNNGVHHYDWGFVCAGNGKLADALKHLAKAEELGCPNEILAKLYQLMGVTNFEARRYDDALINFSKAMRLTGPQLDILHRQAIVFGMKNDAANGLLAANQMKLMAPSDYRGYQTAFRLLLQTARFDDAFKELQRASKYIERNMDFYLDYVKLEMAKRSVDKDDKHLVKAIGIINHALKVTKPTEAQVFEAYLGAAEMYVQLKKPDEAINCLNATANVAESYNGEFSIIPVKLEQHELTEYDLEDMFVEDRTWLEEQFGEYGLMEFAENTEFDEEGGRDYVGALESLQEEEATPEEKYKLDETKDYEPGENKKSSVVRTYVEAYGLKKDYDKLIEYARLLQASSMVADQHTGRFVEYDAMRARGDEGALEKFRDLAKYFKNAAIKDPTDFVATMMRVECHIKLGEYDEAENICRLLSEDARKPLIEKVNKARQGGE